MTILSHNPALSISQAYLYSAFSILSILYVKQKNCVRSVESGFSYYINYKLKVFYSTINFCNKPYLAINLLNLRITDRQILGVFL